MSRLGLSSLDEILVNNDDNDNNNENHDDDDFVNEDNNYSSSSNSNIVSNVCMFSHGPTTDITIHAPQHHPIQQFFAAHIILSLHVII